jgi:hypothetical protein
MSDEVFHDVAYKAQKRDHLLAGLDEFLDAVTVLPPGEWDPAIRIEPPSVVRTSTCKAGFRIRIQFDFESGSSILGRIPIRIWI